MISYFLVCFTSSVDIVDIPVESAEMAGKGRGRPRTRSTVAPGSSTGQSNQNPNAVIVQKVSDLAAAVTSQSTQLRDTSVSVTRLTETG